jgi:hypothetical protein
MEDQKERTVETQKTRVLEYQHFDLRKVKMEKKGADITHHESGSDAGIVHKVGESAPHPELQKKLDALKPLMAKRLGLLEGTDMARHYLKGDLNALQTALDLEKLIISRCNVNGLTFTGSGDKYGVMITGSILVPETGSVGLAVPKITFSQTVLGYEEEAEQLCEEVKKEVYAYRFQNKKAQLDIEFEAKKVEDEQAKEEKKKTGKGGKAKAELV